MNWIEKMIAEQCPNGVERMKLGEVCESIKTGKLNANAQEENGIYPFYTCDANPSRINTFAFDTEAIIVTGNGSQVGHINYYNGKFNAYQRTYVLSEFKNTSIQYILHCFKASLKEYIMDNCRKGSVPYITLPMLQNYPIPLPPLSIQKEIVNVLDKFSELIEKTDEEIALRQKQYEYYREKLLTFEEGEVEWKQLKDVFDTRNGYTPSTKNNEFWNNGDIPWFKMEDIRDNGRILSDSNLHITPKAVKGKGLFSANSIILATSATIGEHALVTVDYLSNQRFTNLSVKKELAEEINIKFYYFYMYLIDNWCKEHTNQGGFASVDMGALYKLLIPVPPMSRQQSIVDTLDKFESLISKLKEERELQQKQYEYYREKLLTF